MFHTIIMIALFVLIASITAGFLYVGVLLIQDEEVVLGAIMLTISAAFAAIELMAALGAAGFIQIPTI